MRRLEPLWDCVLIEPVQSINGIIMVESASLDLKRGKIVAVGDAVKKLKVGEEVYFGVRGRGQETEHLSFDGKDYILCNAAGVVARVVEVNEAQALSEALFGDIKRTDYPQLHARVYVGETPAKPGVVVGGSGSVVEGLDSGEAPKLVKAPWCAACWHSIPWNPHVFDTSKQVVTPHQDPRWKGTRYSCEDCEACHRSLRNFW